MKFKVGDVIIANRSLVQGRFFIRIIKPVKVISTEDYDEETNRLWFNSDPGFGYFPDNSAYYNSDYFIKVKHYDTKLGRILYK